MLYIGNSIIKNGAIEPVDEQLPIGNDAEVYEVIRIHNSHPVFLSDHLQRWRHSMVARGLAMPSWSDKLEQLIEYLALCNMHLTDCDIRITACADGSVQCGFIETDFPTVSMVRNGAYCEILHAMRPDPSL